MTDLARGLQVHPSNAEQLRAWDGDEGAFWAAHAERFDQALAAYQRPFLDAAAIGPDERVLDIGCGTGQIYPFEAGAFDVAISRTGAMFFSDAVMAFQNIAVALRPSGRLVLLVWQPLIANEWIREIATALSGGRHLPPPPPDAPGPFSLADPERVRSILSPAQFADLDIAELRAPFYWGPDAEAAYDLVVGLAGWMMQGLDEVGRSGALAALRASLNAHRTESGIQYESAAWLIRATRT